MDINKGNENLEQAMSNQHTPEENLTITRYSFPTYILTSCINSQLFCKAYLIKSKASSSGEYLQVHDLVSWTMISELMNVIISRSSKF